MHLNQRRSERERADVKRDVFDAEGPRARMQELAKKQTRTAELPLHFAVGSPSVAFVCMLEPIAGAMPAKLDTRGAARPCARGCAAAPVAAENREKRREQRTA
jgi:hypothetical protein